MNTTTKENKNQAAEVKTITLEAAAPKARRRARNAKASNVFTNEKTREEMKAREEEVRKNLKAITWKETEARGKFKKNEKIGLIDDGTLIVGCDVGSEKHFIRAIDSRGRELTKRAFSFCNNEEGLQSCLDRVVGLMAENGKTRAVLGIEPTGHYWFDLADWMVSHGITVVQVNPYAVKQTKEIEDNSQLKDDRKDPKPIANLVKDGNYGMPYRPDGNYAEMRNLSLLKDQLTEDSVRAVNRLHRLVKIYFPEYSQRLYKDIAAPFSIAVLKEAPLPCDIEGLGEEGVRKIWKAAGLKGAGHNKAAALVEAAGHSIGLTDGLESARVSMRLAAETVERIRADLAEVEGMLSEKCLEVENAGNILEIGGIGETILCGILSELGDISRFDSAKEIQKLSGLSLVSCSSGKHNGETRISKRGRKRLRYWLFMGAKSVVAHSDEFGRIHGYYTTRADNPLKRMQSLILIAGKLLRIIYAMLRKGSKYDPSMVGGPDDEAA